MRVLLRNDDVDWDAWPVEDYLTENYRALHAADEAVIAHHSAVFRRLGPGGVDRSAELGSGPNLYPLMLAGAACARVDAYEPGAANVAYLEGQLTAGPDPHWDPFYALCRRHNPDLPASAREALSRVRVVRGGVLDAAGGGYGLASMNFVAESVTEDAAEFATLCRAFVQAVRPGGHLVASFMENMGRYRVGGADWPGFPVDQDIVREVFAPEVVDLDLSRIDADPTLPDWGYTGMILLSARRAPA